MTWLVRWCREHPDAAIACFLTATAVVMLAVAGVVRQPDAAPATIATIGSCGLLAWRRSRPVIVAVVAGVCVAVPFHTAYAAAINDSALFVPVFTAVFLYAYSLGVERTWLRSLPGVAALIIGANLTGGAFNPLPEMVIIGPWLAGLVVASRRQSVEQLELRACELEAEREIFASLAVRHEKARIARELHDIVAHCVSLIVVQANAGERLTHADPQGAAEAFTSISEAAEQADNEIARLVELLDIATPALPNTGLRIVEELVDRARASGLRITCQLSGDYDALCPSSAEAAYRVVQEAVTNAVKHSPGAPICVTVRGLDDDVALEVVNRSAADHRSGLEGTGGGHGLAGMRERVTRCGGRFEIGPTSDGGWRVAAHLPRQAAHGNAPLATGAFPAAAAAG